MAILGKLIGENPEPKPQPNRCPTCNGAHRWLDAFAVWRCARCQPPPLPAMVKQEVGRPDVRQDVKYRFVILGVLTPGQDWVWNDETTPAQREGVVDDCRWFDERN